MKRIVAAVLIFGIIFSGTIPAYADDLGEFPQIKKLGRGLANITTSLFEVPKGMGDAAEQNGMFAGYTWGLLQGVSKFVVRTVVGVYEVATFPIPFPKGYKPILTDPEFFMEKDSDWQELHPTI